MRTSLLCMAMLAHCLALSAQEAVPLKSPGMEADADGDGHPDGWSKVIHGEGFELARDPDEAHTGNASARLVGRPDHGSRACYLQTTAAFTPSKAVRLVFWYKGMGRADGILRFRPAPGVEVEGNQYGTHGFGCAMPQEDWTEYVFEAAVPQAARDADLVRVEIILYQRGEGALWYDDVSVQSLAEWRPKLTPAQSALACPNRPADGRAVLQNPPDFSWTPQPAAARYVLQLSRSPDFPDEATTEIPDLKYNVYSHSAVLDEGAWFWRVRYITEEDETSEWTPTRTFVITDKARPFPVPPPEEVLARVPRDHPRVYATRATLDAFRAPISGARSDWWEGFRKGLDLYAARAIDKEPPADWVYGFREGALTDAIIKQGGKLRSYCAGVTNRTQQLAFGYLLSGEEQYARAAVAQMLEMAAWDPEGITSFRNHDQVFRDITWRMATAYDWCWDAMTEAERETVRDAIVTRATRLYRGFSESSRPIYEYPYDSHGITAYGFLGICAIALAHDSPEADEWLAFIAATYPAIFPPWGGEEGGWCQGVGYWKWSIPFAWWFFDALKSAGGPDMYQKAFSRNNGWYKLYMHPPWCDRHHFGDGNHGPPGAADQSNMAHMARVYDNPYFQWYAKNLPGRPSGGIYPYWWYDEDMPVRPPADIPQGVCFPDIGWVAMHSDLSDPDDIMLMFKSSWYGSFNHSNADQNSFVLYAYGEPLLIDSGYYDWYGSPHDNGWTRQTKAHNCVLINAEGQPIHDITAKGKIIRHFTSPHVDYTCGDATEAYKGKLKSFKRHILYLRPDVFLIYDELEAWKPSDFTWCLHAENEMELRPEENEVIITRGEAKCLVKFIAPEGLEFEQNDEFTPPSVRDLKDEWHAYATTTQKTTKTRFAVLVRPYRASESEDELRVSVVRGDSMSARLWDGKLREDYVAAGDYKGIIQVMEEPEELEALAQARFCAFAPRGTEAEWTRDEGRFVIAVVDGTRFGSGAPGDDVLALDASNPITAVLTVGSVGPSIFVDRIWCQCAETTDVTVPVVALHEVTLDGLALAVSDLQVDADRGTLKLTLPAGDHVIEINPEPKAAQANANIRLTLDGAPLDLDLQTMPTFIGGALSWGDFAAQPGPAMVRSVDANAGARIQIGRQAVRPGEVLWLTESNALVVRATEADAPITIALESLIGNAEPLAARVVPEDAADPPGVLKFEAETYTASGAGSARVYTHREFLSGGAGVETAVIPGQWLTWEFEVPAEGVYNLIVKGATHEPHALRLIDIDGKPLLGEPRVFQFEHTGGFGASPQEWKHLIVCGESGEPLPIQLAEGKHTLRWTLAEGRLNLDYWLLSPARR